MTSVTIAFPDSLHPQQGEQINFQALVQADGSFLVTRVVRRESPIIKQKSQGQPQSLGDWARQWAGIAKLKPGETYDSVKRDAYRARFGA